jgi:calcium-dependent protein kinase
MLSAVLYLHQHGIAHRDLKLENFLFEKPGMHSPLKLIDFGLSKHFDPNESMHQVVGSAYYTAPEVLGGCYDNRCDVWSLGVIAYMLLSGAPPFNGDSSEKIHSLILTREPDYSKKLFPKASEAALDFLRCMLTKDPSKRITVEQAFEHPFLQEARYFHMNSSKIEPSIDVLQSLSRFMRLSRYKKFMLQAVAFSLNPSQISILRDEFNNIDKDRSGTISIAELQEYITKFSPELSPAANRALTLAAENYDSNAEINYIEFLAAAMCKRISIDEERLVLAFETLDIDSKGR